MELCPPEILLNIFALACTDGGPTGCSLSLVSRYIRATSSPVRYHTVALWSLLCMHSFRNVLAANSSHPPRVRHLFLFDTPIPAPLPITAPPTSGVGVLEVAAFIISTLAQSLVTLSGRLCPTTHGVEPISVIPRLPLLNDLSLSFNGLYSISPDASFPNLRRLHKWGRPGQLWRLKDVRDAKVVTRVAPQLTQIRLSNIAPYCVQALHAALKEMLPTQHDSDASVDEIQTQEISQSLQDLFIQLSTINEDPRIPCQRIIRPGRTAQNLLKGFLQEVAAEHLLGSVVVVPLCNYNIHDCFEDWLDVIKGGDGCWRIPPRKTTSTLSLERDVEDARRRCY